MPIAALEVALPDPSIGERVRTLLVEPPTDPVPSPEPVKPTGARRRPKAKP
jgi:hypothetical protein